MIAIDNKLVSDEIIEKSNSFTTWLNKGSCWDGVRAPLALSRLDGVTQLWTDKTMLNKQVLNQLKRMGNMAYDQEFMGYTNY